MTGQCFKYEVCHNILVPILIGVRVCPGQGKSHSSSIQVRAAWSVCCQKRIYSDDSRRATKLQRFLFCPP